MISHVPTYLLPHLQDLEAKLRTISREKRVCGRPAGRRQNDDGLCDDVIVPRHYRV